MNGEKITGKFIEYSGDHSVEKTLKDYLIPNLETILIKIKAYNNYY
jgi:hypothetical protein